MNWWNVAKADIIETNINGVFRPMTPEEILRRDRRSIDISEDEGKIILISPVLDYNGDFSEEVEIVWVRVADPEDDVVRHGFVSAWETVVMLKDLVANSGHALVARVSSKPSCANSRVIFLAPINDDDVCRDGILAGTEALRFAKSNPWW